MCDTPDNTESSEVGVKSPANNTMADNESEKIVEVDSEVENGTVGDVDVTSSSPETGRGDTFLPFQTLAVELEEGVACSDNIPQSETSKIPVIAESSEDTVLSSEGLLNQQENDGDEISVEPISVDSSSDFTERSLLNKDDSVGVAVDESTLGAADESTLGAADELTLGTADESTLGAADESTLGIADESTLEATDLKEEANTSNMDFSSSLVLSEDALDATSCESLNESAKSYLEDFLFSSGSTNMVVDSDSASNDEKGKPLYRFHKIVKNMETADYGTLQVLYRLLYLRNAWDTEKILARRILDFSGFNSEPTSEDYYTREIMLRTMPYETLSSIGKILAIEKKLSPSDFEKSSPSEFEKTKLAYVSEVMGFLQKPKRKSSRVRGAAVRKAGSLGQKAGGTPSSKRAQKAKGSGADAMSKPSKASNNSTLDVSTKISTCPQSQVSIKELGIVIKPGPLSFKLKATMKTYTTEELLEIERDLKLKLNMGKAVQPKVDLKRLDSRTLSLYSGTSASQEDSVDEKGESSTNKGVAEKPVAVEGTAVPQKARKKLRDFPLGVAEKPIAVEATAVPQKVRKKLQDFPLGVAEKPVAVEGTAVPQKVRKKLRDFPLVLSSIEGTPEELLADVHNLLFMEKREMSELKEHILDFSGFLFKEEEEAYKKRRNFLDRMDENKVKSIARALYLEPKDDKDATIIQILSFLKNPNESCLRPTVTPIVLSDWDIDIEAMSDSDDSITCEVVEKKVECIDLLSSGEDSDKEGKKEVVVVIKKEPVEQPQKVIPTPTATVVPVEPPTVASTAPSSSDGSAKSSTRTLSDFETITKIVNTHPTEYLVDIYNLLYMKTYEPATLRTDILAFSGFEFEKGTPEYVKRKQFLDRMLYNSVRRIYNTLIHNTREVKVFSKPTMIGEIFQFLFKLPDTDTSIRPPPPKPSVAPYTLANSGAQANAMSNLVKGLTLPNQSGKLSDLKRVFQRVACFPCEYLVDVHKLLFMTDCDMKDIRANIFNFKGFTFGVDSSDFNQRKMYLEYLTFHSLRKISSVLTTKTVDLRNSTKHELANHLTEVLKEYCNTSFEAENIGPPTITPQGTVVTTQNKPSDAVQPAPTPPETTASVSPSSKPTPPTSTAGDTGIEQIVVTPIIEPLQPSPVASPEAPAVQVQQPALSAQPKDDNMTVSSSTPVVASSQAPVSSTAKLTDPSKEQKGKKFFKTRKRGSANRNSQAARNAPDVSTSVADSAGNQQFADINLPELEKYRRLYEGNQPLKLLQDMQPMDIIGETKFVMPPPMDSQSSASLCFQPDYMLQPVPQPYPPMMPQVPLQMLHTFPPPMHMPNPPYMMPAHPMRPKLTSVTQDDLGKGAAAFLAESVLTEESDSGPAPKRPRRMSGSHDKHIGGVENIRILESSSLADKKDDAVNSSSSIFQLKIRDAMTKASEDEEDCDKPLATLVGHPNDKVLKQQICEIVENTDLQEITINGVIQKIFNMYPKFNLNYRKEFIKSTLRSLLYRLGEQENSKGDRNLSAASNSPDCSVSTTDRCDSPDLCKSPPLEPIPQAVQSKFPSSATSFHQVQKS